MWMKKKSKADVEKIGGKRPGGSFSQKKGC